MSAKDNFAQAMKELLNTGDGNNMEAESKKAASGSSFSAFSSDEARPPRAPAPEKKKPEEHNEPSYSGVSSAVKMASVEVPPANEVPSSAYAVPPVALSRPAVVSGNSASTRSAGSTASKVSNTNEEVTVIVQGTTVVGDIITSGGLRVNGNIKGNLRVAAKLMLNGKVVGDIEAEDVDISGSEVKGNVTARKTITIDNHTVIVGDMNAQNVESNGKMKGNISVYERAHFLEESILVGNLVSGTVIIDEGATLKGDISITSAQTENISVDEPDFDISME